MGTIWCPGGHNFPDTLGPSPDAWLLIADEKLEIILDELVDMFKRDLAVDDFEDRAAHSVSSHSVPAYVCPDCGRLIVFENGLDKPATSYRRE